MPILRNPSDTDLFSVVLHEIVPAFGSVEITEEQAEQVNTLSGVWQISDGATHAEPEDAEPIPARRTAQKRGGKTVEVTERDVETR